MVSLGSFGLGLMLLQSDSWSWDSGGLEHLEAVQASLSVESSVSSCSCSSRGGLREAEWAPGVCVLQAVSSLMAWASQVIEHQFCSTLLIKMVTTAPCIPRGGDTGSPLVGGVSKSCCTRSMWCRGTCYGHFWKIWSTSPSKTQQCLVIPLWKNLEGLLSPRGKIDFGKL